jgi:predicted nuclease of restriction endonuclease-like (RecB) superfamily
MSEMTLADDGGLSEDELFTQASVLIEEGQAVASRQANLALTVTFWRLGRLVGSEVLGSQRAAYGKRIVVSLGRRLVERYGPSYEEKNLRRMIQFAQVFPDEEIVVSVGRQLSWTHFRALLPLKSEEAREFYIREAIGRHLNVRELRHAISRKAYERREIADSQIPEGSATPLDVFRDPMLLDMLGLADTYLERDLETAIIRELEPFLLEVGQGWAFVARQKRMIVDGDDFYLDVLFFSRPLKRLIAVELKVGKFLPSYQGQMNLYLKWLDKNERQPGEEAPIGLILCTEASRERIELLELHKDGIIVAEYWATLPPKAELEAKITQLYRAAQDRIASRQLHAAPFDNEGAADE